MKRKSILTLVCAAAVAAGAYAQNPYLPMWEYIPDGEPYVFEDPDCPGKYRVYVYGSHDDLIDTYCGRDQVVWSAPVEDLSAWRYDGVIFTSVTDADGQLLNPEGIGDILYAPDVAVKTDADGKKKYYLYPNNQSGGRNGQIAVSDRPDGPFKVCNWSKTHPMLSDGVLTFDPGVFVDDDGRVYGYWGFEKSYGAELDPETMATVKPGTEIVTDMVSNWYQEGVFRFFEASSIRKIEDKYVFIYSRKTADGEFGLPVSNYTLAYAYSDHPLGPWTYGGTLVDCRARDIDDNGNTVMTAVPYGNTHGSICEINGQWWCFYHRQTGLDQFSRQAMVAPVTVSVEKGPGGKVTISEAEFNSEGFRTEGLNPLNKSAAGWACWFKYPKGSSEKFPDFWFSGSYVKPTRLNANSFEGPFNLKQPYCPVVNNTSGSIVGYKYFNFDVLGKCASSRLVMHIKPEGVNGSIRVLVGGPDTAHGGKVIATAVVLASDPQEIQKVSVMTEGLAGISGKQPLFFSFASTEEDKSICELHDFQFVLD